MVTACHSRINPNSDGIVAIVCDSSIEIYTEIMSPVFCVQTLGGCSMHGGLNQGGSRRAFFLLWEGST